MIITGNKRTDKIRIIDKTTSLDNLNLSAFSLTIWDWVILNNL